MCWPRKTGQTDGPQRPHPEAGQPARDQPSDWPQATLENFELVMTKMAEVARPQDRVMLLISTHSNPGTLNINIAGKTPRPSPPGA